MVRHVVILKLAGTAPEEVSGIREALEELPGLIPSIRGYVVGVDLGLDPTGAHIAVVADFDDVAGFEAYRDDPSHRRVIAERIAPVLQDRVASQFEL